MPTDDADDWVVVGRVGAPHGVRGDVFVVPWTDVPEQRFSTGTVLRTDRPDSPTLTVDVARDHSGRLVVHFAGVTDRAAAGALRGTHLTVRAGDRDALEDPDEFYDSDLEGLSAVTPDGRSLGRVTGVVHAPGSDYLVLAAGTADEGPERLVPFVAAIVPTVDLAAGRVVVDPPEGLLDL